MAFESTKVAIKQNKLFTNTKVEFTKELDIIDGIDGILSVNGLSRVLSKEVIDGKLEIRGKTKFDILVTQNNELKSFAQDIDWNKSVDASILGNAMIVLKDTKLFVESDTSIKGVVEFDVYSEAMDIISPVKVEDDIEIRTEEKEVVNLVGNLNNSFTITQEVEENKIKEILSKSARVVSYVSTSGVDAYTIEGIVEVSLLVNDGESICEIKKNLEFKQELPFVGMLPTNKIYNSLNIVTLMCSLSDNEEKSVVLFAIDVDDNASAYENVAMITLQDAYSVQNTLIQSQECVNVVTGQEKRVFASQVTASVNMENEFFQEIVGVSAAFVKNVEVTNNGISCMLEYNVLYRIENGNVVSKKCEEGVVVAADNVFENYILNSNVILDSCKVKFGNEIDLLFTVQFEVLSKKWEYLTYVTAIEKGEEYLEEKPAIGVYVVKEGDELFDVAKVLRVSIDQIKEQNENVDNLSAGQKIIVYNKLEYNA